MRARTGAGHDPMRSAGALLTVAALVALAVVLPAPGAEAPPAAGLPPLPDEEAGLPALPERSARNASYAIEARLDPEQHTIEGRLVLEWSNIAGQAVSDFPFHLYWNAFRNNLSTAARGEGRRALNNRPRKQRSYGWIRVKSVRRLGEEDEDLTSTLRYPSPDGNTDDRTVMEVRSARAVAPGETVRFAIEWDSLIPHGEIGRAGWVHDYNFIVQWFPKIGVLTKQGWNCHPFHPWSEFFSDFGIYDVRLTLPRGFVVGATGRLEATSPNADGTETHHFVQEDVHDFAWTASRRFLERRARFEEPGYPPVEIRLLVQPEHDHLSDRYIEATRIALRSFGTWSAPYPYAQLTVVDPAWSSRSGGMEYPTLFTGGTSVFAPQELRSPDSVTVHEAGHQFWYGLVANNEFEEAWLDEGFNTYMTTKALATALGPSGWGRRYFGPEGRSGWPVVAPGVEVYRGMDRLALLRETGETDVMARPAWAYRTSDSYGLNSYGKPALTLQTLEGLVGDETMTRILRVYARRYRFAHPTTDDFIAVVNEVTGGEWRWFFEQTFFSSELVDYAVEARNVPTRVLEGYREGPERTLSFERPPEIQRADEGPFSSRVEVSRRGGARMPVEVLVEFEDGRHVSASWDGRERWKRFEYEGSRVVRAVVDPRGRIALDVNPANNVWVEERGPARRAATKWAMRWMFWLQNLLELHTILG